MYCCLVLNTTYPPYNTRIAILTSIVLLILYIHQQSGFMVPSKTSRSLPPNNLNTAQSLPCSSPLDQVLIPVFALGRAQELCILLETYWERMNLKVPIYFTMGLTGRVSCISRNYFELILIYILCAFTFVISSNFF